LDELSNELYRVEGFRETEDVINTIESVNNNILQASAKREDNHESISCCNSLELVNFNLQSAVIFMSMDEEEVD
jgi:hypothetical protein